MKNGIEMVVTLMTLLSVNVCHADENEKEHAMAEVRTVTVGQVSLRVSIAARCVAGHEILCEVSMTNAGNREVSYGHISAYKDFAVEVKNTTNGPVPLTLFGKLNQEGEVWRIKHTLRKLLPGKTLSCRYNLSRFFDLSVSGDYTLTVSREINQFSGDNYAVLKVERIPFTVIE